MKAIRFTLPEFPGERAEPGDLWRVAEAAAGLVTFERVEAEPGTFRSRKDGLHPRLPDVRPISAEEARALTAEMDAAMDAASARVSAWPFSPDNPLNQTPAVDDRVRR